jgi:predicted peptidase
MITRRDAIRWMTAAAAGAWLAPAFGDDTHSAQRLALIESFKKISDGLERKFEARTFKSDFEMPYRLFRPAATGKLPLVIYLHGSGGLGTDNEKQLQLGNIFGTRVWLLPENQKKFPCYVVAPQTDRGWVRYEIDPKTHEAVGITPGLGDGSRVALEIIDALRKELPIDSRRIYIAGQSMGGAGVWNMLSGRPGFFAAAVVCCGSRSADDGTASPNTALWNFHGIDDKTVPIEVSRERLAARRKAGGHPRSTEYAGVDHNSWEWAFTEPDLVKWLSTQTA